MPTEFFWSQCFLSLDVLPFTVRACVNLIHQHPSFFKTYLSCYDPLYILFRYTLANSSMRSVYGGHFFTSFLKKNVAKNLHMVK